MRTAMLFSALCLVSCAAASPPAPEQPPADGSITVVIPRERAEACRAEGGCGLVTLREVDALRQEAMRIGAREVIKTLDTHGCRRDIT